MDPRSDHVVALNEEIHKQAEIMIFKKCVDRNSINNFVDIKLAL